MIGDTQLDDTELSRIAAENRNLKNTLGALRERLEGARAEEQERGQSAAAAAIVWRSGSELGLRFDRGQEKIAEVIMGLAVYG